MHIFHNWTKWNYYKVEVFNQIRQDFQIVKRRKRNCKTCLIERKKDL